MRLYITKSKSYGHSTLNFSEFKVETLMRIASETSNQDVLDVLSESQEFRIQLTVYENPNTRPNTKKAMLKKPKFQMFLLENAQNLSEEELLELAGYENATRKFLELLPSLSSTPNQIKEIISENLKKQQSNIVKTILDAKPSTTGSPFAPLEGAELCLSLLNSPAADKEVVELTIAKLWSMNFRIYHCSLLPEILLNPQSNSAHLEACLASIANYYDVDSVKECLSDERLTKDSLERLIHLYPNSSLSNIIEHRTQSILSNRFGNEYKNYIISLITTSGSNSYEPKNGHIWPIQALIQTTNSKTVLEFIIAKANHIIFRMTHKKQNEEINEEIISMAERKIRELS